MLPNTMCSRMPHYNHLHVITSRDIFNLAWAMGGRSCFVVRFECKIATHVCGARCRSVVMTMAVMVVTSVVVR